MKNLILIVTSCLLIFLTSCNGESLDIPPEKAIIGKWKLIKQGTPGQLYKVDSDTYNQYFKDSVLFIRNLDSNEILGQYEYWMVDSLLVDEYWIIDSFLMEQYTWIDTEYNDTIVTTLPYKFKFLDINTLKVDMIYLAVTPTGIYKRIP